MPDVLLLRAYKSNLLLGNPVTMQVEIYLQLSYFARFWTIGRVGYFFVSRTALFITSRSTIFFQKSRKGIAGLCREKSVVYSVFRPGRLLITLVLMLFAEALSTKVKHIIMSF